MSKPKISIGLDIGVTSVGYSIVEVNEEKDDITILQQGVRLFDDVASPKDGTLQNKTRGESRRLRRRLRRLKLRKSNAKQLFIDYKLAFDKNDLESKLDKIDITKLTREDGSNKPYDIVHQIICDGLENEFKYEKEQKVILCLFHYIKNRGYTYLDDEDDNNSNNQEIIDETLEEVYDKTKLPSQRILQFWNKKGYYKKSEVSNNSIQENLKEVEVFLNKQNLVEGFKEKFKDLFKRCRNFDEGPGGKNSPTKWGKYRYNENNEIVQCCDHLWEKTIGKCSLYSKFNDDFMNQEFNNIPIKIKNYFLENGKPNIYRAGKNSPIAEVYNLFNDLSNIKINGKIIQKEYLNLIVEKINLLVYEKINKDIKKLELKTKEIEKWINEYSGNVNKIKGFRTDQKKESSYITNLNNYFGILKLFKEQNKLNWNDNIFEINLILEANKIFDSYWKNNKNLEYISNELDIPIEILPKNLEKVNKTHSLCSKALYDYIKYFKNYLVSSVEEDIENFSSYQLDFLNENEKWLTNISYGKYLTNSLFDGVTISATARRSCNQTIKVINQILSDYIYNEKYDLKTITIELANDKNSYEEKNRISKLQKNREKENKDLEEELLSCNVKANTHNKIKLKLLKEQNYIDIYSGEKIELADLGDTEIDHIIPYSICNNDSLENKVLVYRVNNQNKKNRIPHDYMSSQEFESLKVRVNDNKNFTKNKRKYLLMEDSSVECLTEFTSRTLNDTRTTTKLILEKFKDFFRNSEYFKAKKKKVVINNIRGGITNYARKAFKDMYIIKDRDILKHHAIDASIVAFLGNKNKIAKNLSLGEMYKDSYYLEEQDGVFIDKRTGEVVWEPIDQLIKKPENISFFKRLNELNQEDNNETLFSKMIDSKKTFQISDSKPISVVYDQKTNKWNNIKKISLIDNNDLKKINEYFSEQKNIENLICYINDRQLYDKLKKIYDSYKNSELSKNPFVSYMLENFNDDVVVIKEKNKKIKTIRYIKVEQDSGNFQIIKNLKYIDSSINNLDKKIIKQKNKNKQKKDNKLHAGLLDSLGQSFYRLYKNKKNKIVMCVFNALLLNFKDNKTYIKEDKLNQWLEQNNIDNKDEYITIKKGSIFKYKGNNSKNKTWLNYGSLWYFNKLNISSNNIELNRLDKKYKKLDKKYKKEDKANNISASKILQEYDLYNVDHLGNLYKVKIPDHWKK